MDKGILRIYFRHHKRHIIVHAESAAVVYHQRAEPRYVIGILARHTAASRHKGNVYVPELLAVPQFLYPQVLAAETASLASAAARTEQTKTGERKTALLEHTQKLLPNSTTCAYYSYSLFYHCLVSLFY
jgi:hypothetical protein